MSTKAELEAEIAQLKQQLNTKQVVPTKLKPVVRDGALASTLRGQEISKPEYEFLVNNPTFNELFRQLFLLAPKTLQRTHKVDFNKKRQKLKNTIANFYRESTGVDWEALTINVMGRDHFKPKPNDVIIITLAAPLIQKNPLKNDSELLSKPGDKLLKVIKIHSNDVLKAGDYETKLL